MSELTWINFFFKVLLTSPAPVNTLNITYTCVNFVFHEIVIINKCYVINVINVINKCYVSKKIQETNIGFSNWSFFLVFFSLCFSCAYHFSFLLLTNIRGTKRQKTRINKASNINKIITMSSWRNQDKRPYGIFRRII